MKNFKLNGRKLINADVISPEFVVATFSKELNQYGVEDNFLTFKYGAKLLEICNKYKGQRNISIVEAMLNEIDVVLLEYAYDKTCNRKKN